MHRGNCRPRRDLYLNPEILCPLVSQVPKGYQSRWRPELQFARGDDSVHASRFQIYAPLQEFRWAGDDFELSPEIWIRRRADLPDLQGSVKWLSKEEQTRALLADHWLTFVWSENDERSPA